MTIAKVTQRGTPENPIFDFELPAGPKGEPGIGWNATFLMETNLNDVTTPGVYRQDQAVNATMERNYPIAATPGCGILMVSVQNASGTPAIQQQFTSVWGAHGSKGIYLRSRTGTNWGAWTFIPSQRVDQTAGRAIYIWDHVNGREQLIYGDTGYREMNTLLENGWTSDGSIRLRRTNTEVELVCYGLISTNATSQKFLSIPNGFRPYNNISFEGITARSYEGDVIRALGSTRLGDQYNGRSFIWKTIQPWPTAAPGTALGTIPAA